jgi:Methyl-accepting chemotaxis protein (MCP) signaling domain.
MRRGSQEVNEGLVLADRAGESLRKIIDNATKAVDMINQIAAASEEQSATSEEISRSIEAIPRYLPSRHLESSKLQRQLTK